MQLPRDITDTRSLRIALEQIAKQFDNYGVVTLTPSATSTVVVNAKINSGSAIFLQPITANAGAAYATTIPTAGSGTLTLTHTSTSTTDRTFRYLIMGV